MTKLLSTALMILCAVTAITDAAHNANASKQDLPKIAVYVTGKGEVKEKSALATYMLDALIKSGKYVAVERSERFLAQLDNEQLKQRSGAIDDAQISSVGKQSGVDYICVADITSAMNGYQISARILNAETAQVSAIGVVTESSVASMDEMERIAYGAVNKMLGTRLHADAGASAIHGDGDAELLVVGPGGVFSSGIIIVYIDNERYASMRGDATLKQPILSGTRFLSIKYQGDGTVREMKSPVKFAVKKGERAAFKVSMEMFKPVKVAKVKK